MRRPRHANIFIAAMVVLGLAEFLTVAVDWHSSSLTKFFCYLLITVAGSLLKVKLPGVTSTMSLNFLFVLVAITELSIPEALFIGCIATLIQSLWRTRSKPRVMPVVFHIMTITVAVTLTGCVSGATFLRGLGPNDPIRVAVVACVYFIANTFPVAAIIALTERKPFQRIWKDCYFWSFPYYIIGAGIAQVLHLPNH